MKKIQQASHSISLRLLRGSTWSTKNAARAPTTAPNAAAATTTSSRTTGLIRQCLSVWEMTSTQLETFPRKEETELFLRTENTTSFQVATKRQLSKQPSPSTTSTISMATKKINICKTTILRRLCWRKKGIDSKSTSTWANVSASQTQIQNTEKEINRETSWDNKN